MQKEFTPDAIEATKDLPPGEHERWVGVRANPELAGFQGAKINSARINTESSDVIVDVERDPRLRDLLLRVQHIVGRKFSDFYDKVTNLELFTGQRDGEVIVENLAMATLQTLADFRNGNIEGEDQLGEILVGDALQFRDSPRLRALALEAVMKASSICSAHPMVVVLGAEDQETSKEVRVDLHMEFKKHRADPADRKATVPNEYVILTTELNVSGKIYPPGTMFPAQFYLNELDKIGGSREIIQLPPAFETIPEEERIRDINSSRGLSLELANIENAANLRTFRALLPALSLDEDIFSLEPGRAKSSKDFAEAIFATGNKDLISLHKHLMDNFRRIEKVGVNVEFLPADALYRRYHEAVISAMNPRRANNLSKAIYMAEPFFAGNPFVQEFAQDLLLDEFQVQRGEYFELKDLIESKKLSREPFTAQEIERIYKFGSTIVQRLCDPLETELGTEK